MKFYSNNMINIFEKIIFENLMYFGDICNKLIKYNLLKVYLIIFHRSNC